MTVTACTHCITKGKVHEFYDRKRIINVKGTPDKTKGKGKVVPVIF
jgi:hypothetical protein